MLRLSRLAVILVPLSAVSLHAQATPQPAKPPAGKKAPAAPQKTQESRQDALFRQAREAFNKQECDTATRLLNELIALEPKDAAAHFLLAYCYYEMGKKPEAIAAFEKTIELDPTYVPARHNLALLLIQTNQFERAAEELKKSLEIEAGPPKTRLVYGQVLERLGKNAEAQAQYQQIANWADSELEVRKGLARTALALGQHTEAEAQFRKWLAADPGSGDARLGVAKALLGQGKARDAIPIMREYVDQVRSDLEARILLGQLYLEAGQKEFGIAELRGVLEIDPKNQEALGSLADGLASAERWTEAAPLYARLTELEPRKPEYFYRLGQARLHAREFEAAQDAFLRAIQLKPDYADALSELAGGLVVAERYAQALPVLDRLAQLRPDTPGTLFLRALCYDHLHQPAPAVEFYQKFLGSSDGQHPDQEFQARSRIRILMREIKK